MNTPLFSCAAGALLACAALSALAQVTADPADAKAPVPPQVYRSSLQQYQPLRDTELADWRAANRRVQEAGGWRAYAREAAASSASAASAPVHPH